MTDATISAPKRDWLLNGARVLTIIVIVALIFAMVMVGIGFGALLIGMAVGSADIIAGLAEKGIPASMVWSIAGILALVFAVLWIAHDFMRTLLKVINSVGEGQPFAPENAQRLKRMGWLTIAGQLMALPIGALAFAIAQAAEKTGGKVHVDGDFGLDLGTILLTLILFILARVFEHGARLEDDMEGTV